ncbi:kinase-like domain-containing protein [Dactylonectria macrodidyma]|uniref:non-specific serine/threonine protein kinase n=1 Tax=Dactylonectria macrodidyma TaxID=307937 RepID=A0A9P9FW49_9HYPO|nr:kinase-like domain-containing protein [Dactylonectria macrodidyma]
MRYGLVAPALCRSVLRNQRLRAQVCERGLRKLSSYKSGRPFEEERCRNYNPMHFYPARIGDTLGGKYELVSKLGWGTGSTVWLARATHWLPWQTEHHVALKITNNTPAVQAAARRELDVSDQMFTAETTHPGRQYVRSVLDSFEVEGPNGTHICLAFEPLRQPLWMLGQQSGLTGLVQPRTIKAVLPSILKSLDFLHSECQMIHTDLKGDHLMVPFEDSRVLDEYVIRQNANPAPCQERNGRPVYESRSSFGHLTADIGYVKLTDFGLAVRGNVPHHHDIQPREYTAPEVMLKAGWSYPVDIWNLGLVLWELLGDVNLLSGRIPGHCKFSNNTRWAQMIRLLGPPPSELLARADRESLAKYYDEQGVFKHPELIPDEMFTLSNSTPMLEGQERALFIEFAKRMLTWLPEKRATAKELLEDPWLKSVGRHRATGFGYLEDTRLE